MKPKELGQTGQGDMFRARLDQILDMSHEKVVLADKIDWDFLAARCGAAYSDKPGHPALATRLMAGLHILKYADDLSDEEICARFVENPYYQYFCGEEFFRHDLPLDRSSLTRWRQRMGEEKLQALLQESLAVAVKLGAAKPADFTRAIVDTTDAEKNVAFPTDAKLILRARERLVRHAKALPGRPYDGHTLQSVTPDIEDLTGATLTRILADAGYRGHNAPKSHKFRVVAGQKRRVTPAIKRQMKRRAAVEPVIGHLKDGHRMGRNFLAHRQGDAINPILAAAGYNFRLILKWIRLLCAHIWMVVLVHPSTKSA